MRGLSLDLQMRLFRKMAENALNAAGNFLYCHWMLTLNQLTSVKLPLLFVA
jgi:hypothetical protein